MSHRIRHLRKWLPLLLIVAFGAWLRLYQIGTLPPGFYRDEAYDALDGLNILHGHLAIFFVANNGREGLFMYLLAGAIALFGRTPEAARLVSAVIGTLTTLAIYATGRAMFSHRIGVLSAAILAVTFWHVALSRIALRAILLPLMLCIFVALAAAALRLIVSEDTSGKRQRQAALISLIAGMSFSLVFYTYTAAQFLLPLVIGYVILCILLGRLRIEGYRWPAWKTARLPALAFAAGALLAGSALIYWLLRHSDLYYLRAGQVSILSASVNHGDLIGTFIDNIAKAAGMFAFQGDRIWRHNLSLRPVFDGGVAIGFLLGIPVLIGRVFRGRATAAHPSSRSSPAYAYSIRPASLFALLWLAVFLIPTILAEDAPHFLRAIGALPAACLVAAIGMEWALAWISRRGVLSLYLGRFSRLVSPPALIAALLIALAAFSTYTAYFDDYVHNPVTAYWLEDNNVVLAETVNAYTSSHSAQSLWIQDRLVNDNPALWFLSPAVDDGSVTIAGNGRDFPAATDVMLLVDPNHDWTALRNRLPAGSTLAVSAGPLAQADKELKPRRAFIAVSASRTAKHESLAPQFGPSIQLVHVALQDATGRRVAGSQYPLVESLRSNGTALFGGVYTVTLSWTTTQPIKQDLAVFVHWWRGGNMIAQHDGSPALGYLPMPTWRPGDVILDQHVLSIPGGIQPGDEVRVGIYFRGDNTRLPIAGAGLPADDNSVLIFKYPAAQP